MFIVVERPEGKMKKTAQLNKLATWYVILGKLHIIYLPRHKQGTESTLPLRRCPFSELVLQAKTKMSEFVHISDCVIYDSICSNKNTRKTQAKRENNSFAPTSLNLSPLLYGKPQCVSSASSNWAQFNCIFFFQSPAHEILRLALKVWQLCSLWPQYNPTTGKQYVQMYTLNSTAKWREHHVFKSKTGDQ